MSNLKELLTQNRAMRRLRATRYFHGMRWNKRGNVVMDRLHGGRDTTGIKFTRPGVMHDNNVHQNGSPRFGDGMTNHERVQRQRIDSNRIGR